MVILSNLHDIWVITNEYRGTGFILVLYAAALIYLLITEKNRRNRFLLVYLPLSLLLLVYCPVFYHIYVVYLDDSGTYYRIFWLFPMTITLAYAGCKAIYRHRRIGTAVLAAAIIICGGYAYSEKTATITKAENAYHIPDYVIDLCDQMKPDIEGVDIYACVPTEMLFYVRQYNAEINLLYGRDAVEPKWGYYNEFYQKYELDETLDLEGFLELARNNGDKVCTYYVIPEERKISGDPEQLGLEKIDEVNGCILYKDTVAVDIIREMFKGTAYEQ